MTCPDCGREVSDRAPSCPGCGAPIAWHEPAEAPPLSGRVERKTESMGTGCLVQGIGVPALFFFPFGTVIGVILLILGSRMATYHVCSECKTKLGGKDARVCPACHAVLG